MSEINPMKSETTVVWQWLRINVPTLLAIGGLVWYTASDNARTLSRIETIEQSRVERSQIADQKFSSINVQIGALSQRVEPLANLTYRIDRAEVQIGETNKRLDRLSETILGSLDLIRRDVNGLSTRIEVLSQKVDSIPGNGPSRRADASPPSIIPRAVQ